MGTGVNGIGVWGSHDGSGWGVYGRTEGALGRGVFGEVIGTGGFAGYFQGTSSGVGVLASGAESNGALAALQVRNGSHTLAIDGNEIDTNAATLHISTNSGSDIAIALGGGQVGVGTDEFGSFETMRIWAPHNNVPLACEKTGTGSIVDFYNGNTLAGAITLAANNTILYTDFTGAHLATTTASLPSDALVRMTGKNEWLEADRMGEVVYGVELSTRANDPACLGVYMGEQQTGANGSLTRQLIAAVGNGEMWVARRGEAAINPGDALISADVPGCAMLDDPARFDIGYVIARAAERIDWSNVEADEQGIKRAKVSVLFEPFIRDSRGAALEDVVAAQAQRIESLEAQLVGLQQAVQSMQNEQAFAQAK
jgi:hypothetical protein